MIALLAVGFSEGCSGGDSMKLVQTTPELAAAANSAAEAAGGWGPAGTETNVDEIYGTMSEFNKEFSNLGMVIALAGAGSIDEALTAPDNQAMTLDPAGVGGCFKNGDGVECNYDSTGVNSNGYGVRLFGNIAFEGDARVYSFTVVVVAEDSNEEYTFAGKPVFSAKPLQLGESAGLGNLGQTKSYLGVLGGTLEMAGTIVAGARGSVRTYYMGVDLDALTFDANNCASGGTLGLRHRVSSDGETSIDAEYLVAFQGCNNMKVWRRSLRQ